MDKFDVFVWVDGEDGVTAAMATRALRQKFKAEVGDWYMLGPKSERSERLAYDLGMKPLLRPEKVAELGALAALHGASPFVLLWSGAAVLTADWIPVQAGHVRIWEPVPAAVLPRGDLPGSGAGGWPELQSLTSLPRTLLPANQVKTVGAGDFEKAVHAQGWPFGHSVVILEPSTNRR
jgi:hypothetical protein